MIESFIANLANLLPFGYSYSAGMVTAVSPCGIAMLPVYISLHLGAQEQGFWSQSVLRRIAKALAMSGVVTLGFVVLFGIVGLVTSLIGQSLLKVAPWISVVIGVTLILVGIYLLFGRHIYTSLPARLASHMRRQGDLGIKGFLVFGIAYGIAALSCTFPIFMVVVAGAITANGITSGLFQFVSFALGMGFIIAIVTLSSALFKDTVNRWLRRLVPIIARLHGLLLILAGSYILYYWFVVGELLS